MSPDADFCAPPRGSDPSAHDSTPAVALPFEAALAGRAPGTSASAWVVGALRAAGATWALLAFDPERTFRRVSWGSGGAAPLVLAFLWVGPSLLVGLGLEGVLAGGASSRAGAWMVAAAVLSPPVYLFVRAHGLHLYLLLRGRMGAPFAATLRACAYAGAAAGPLLAIPFVGSGLFLAAGAALEAAALRRAHQLALREALGAEMALAAALVIGLVAALLPGALWWSLSAS